MGVSSYQTRIVVIVVSLSVLVMGCATITSIERRVAEVTIEDGIDESEAKVIAQEVIYRDAFLGQWSYVIGAPRVRHDESVRQYENFWFVDFPPKRPINIDRRWLVVVGKRAGRVVLSAPYMMKNGDDVEAVLVDVGLDLAHPEADSIRVFNPSTGRWAAESKTGSISENN